MWPILITSAVASELATLLDYSLDAQVAMRFASTTVSLQFHNARDCTQLETLKLQKPRHARLSTLTIATTDCVTVGQVEATADAVTQFETAVASGHEGAIVHSYDLDSLMLQVSIAPHAPLNVTLTYEEVLERKAGGVSLVLPLSPGLPAERVSARLTVEEPAGGISGLDCQAEVAAARRLSETGGLAAATDGGVQVLTSALSATSATAEVQVAPAAARAARGFAARVACEYTPAPLPDEGVLLFAPAEAARGAAAAGGAEAGAPSGDATFLYLFAPPSVQTALPRRVQLVVDVSGSMSGGRLRDAKLAAEQIVAMLSEQDELAMVSFDSQINTGAAFAREAATAAARERARAWIGALEVGGGTNLEEAARVGLEQLTAGELGGKVPLLVLLTDGEATNGVTAHAAIRANARAANHGGAASVWSFAVGAGADFNLLLGLSVDNGGSAFHVYEGYGSVAEQIAAAAAAALGSVLLSGVEAAVTGVEVDAGAGPLTRLPLLAEGSEMLLMGECTACVGGELTVTTTAAAAEGAVAFTATAALANASADAWLAPPVAAALRRRLKHAQLGQVTAAAALHRAAGDGAAADAARAQALALALAPPRLVWPGLTSMVATRPASCDAPADEGGGGGAPPPRCEGGGAEGALDEEQLELGGLVGASPVAGGALRADLASEASALTGRSGGGLAGGTIGIGVAGAVVLALLGAGAAWLVRRRRLRRATLQKNAGAGAGRVAYQRQRSSALGAPAQQPAAEMVVVQPLDDAPAA